MTPIVTNCSTLLPVSWKHEEKIYVGYAVESLEGRKYVSTIGLLTGLNFDPTTKLIYCHVAGNNAKTFELLVKRGDTGELAFVGSGNELRFLQEYK